MIAQIPRLMALSASLLLSGALFGNDPVPSKESLEGAFPANKSYSPYAGRNFPTQVFWGDTHVHTGMSMDAGAFGARLEPDDAYRFAKGNEVTSSTGQRVKLSRPLDWLVVADHSDNMGFFPRLYDGEPSMLADPTGRRWYDMIQEGGKAGVEAAVEIIQAITGNSFPQALASLPGSEAYRDAWDLTIKAAEDNNDPGNFTAFIGYEWTSTEKGYNLHRVVVYRDDASKASVMEPLTTLSPYGSPDPRDLWKWMQQYEDKTGGTMLAIAHNGNLSNGNMFPESRTYFGDRVDKDYAQKRIRWEPLYEATQIKGDGETHPLLSPDDEFADYETWDQGNLDLTSLKEDDMLQYEYARSGLQIGLQLEQDLGVNPYKFGLVGATDTHTGLSTAEEENFFGKHSGAEPSPGRVSHPMAKVGDKEYTGWGMVASGYQGIWASENTREALFDAMMRKETYATTGPRMLVRFFGGWDFVDADAKGRLPADIGYLKGVPMGGDLKKAPDGKAPSFLVAALKDPLSGNLDRIQIVKGWVDGRGNRQEKVYDVAWSGDRQPGPGGKLPPVGNTVDVANATWTNTIGSTELISVWADPDFDPKVSAFYYVRVLEIPTPRWTAYEAKRFNIEMPSPDVPMTTQERAYTSPIWYTP
ncbi:MAG: DUF3604 domain-containing protein [Xanthomonadales bacterium]|jgi:hypothetical protein|nr:DUF3604 domain-containing protein [Xanthomonadales bacterium]MDH3939981.1 DUF3604 domain-containing protein [Xanthomonadales bacterium]MDH4001923.1 DUF3604 domain-containing protein [Xanthomonadales bacterium]